MGGKDRLKSAVYNGATLIILMIVVMCLPAGFVFVIAPSFVYRLLVYGLKIIIRPDLKTMLPKLSAVFANDVFQPSPKLNLLLTMHFEEDLRTPLTIDVVRTTFLEKVVESRTSDGSLRYPELKMFPTPWMGLMFWKPIESFDLHDRIYQLEDHADLNENYLNQIKSSLLKKSMYSDKRLWEAVLIRRTTSASFRSGVTSVLFIKLHHCIADGHVMMNFASKVFNFRSKKELYDENALRAQLTPKLSLFQWINFQLQLIFKGSFQEVKALLKSVDINDWHSGGNQESGEMVMADCSVPLPLLKKVKNQLNASFTALLCASIAGAVRRTMLDQNKNLPGEIFLAVVLPVPGHPDKLRIHSGLGGICIPIKDGFDRLKRLRIVDENVQKMKESMVAHASFFLGQIIGFSNFAGPLKIATAFDNATVRKMSVWAGFGPGTMAFGILAVSYAQKYNFVTIFNKAIIPTEAGIHNFNNYILQEINEYEKINML